MLVAKDAELSRRIGFERQRIDERPVDRQVDLFFMVGQGNLIPILVFDGQPSDLELARFDVDHGFRIEIVKGAHRVVDWYIMKLQTLGVQDQGCIA